jgi:CubicO group peptidase (beta-lactamase class C family)
MDAFSKFLEAACVEGKLPGAVVAATNISGSLNYVQAFGKKYLDDGTPCETDTIMAIFSATKLVTTIATLQLVEKGNIGLDDDVSNVLPHLAALEVLHEMNDGKGVLKKKEAGYDTPVSSFFLTRF